MKKLVEILAWIGNRIGKPPGWERVVRWFAPPEKCLSMREICVVRDSIAFLAQPSIPIGWHIAFFGTYEPESRAIFRAILPVGGVALDVGANVGWHTLLMARLVGDSGLVLAAEPNPSVRRRLEANLKLNRFGQVKVIPYAIAAIEGNVEFYGPEADDADSGNGHITTASATGQSSVYRVETRRLDAILPVAKITRLDLIKIDVEGYEWPVLNGATQTIAKFRPHIVFEYNAEYTSRGEGSAQLLWQFFQQNHYRLFAIGRNWAEEVQLNNGSSANQMGVLKG